MDLCVFCISRISISCKLNFPAILTNFPVLVFDRCHGQTDSWLNGNFTDQLETSPYYLKDFQIVSYPRTSFSGFSYKSFGCVLLSSGFSTIALSSVLSYCDIIQHRTYKQHNFTFPSYMETLQLIRKLQDISLVDVHIFWKTSILSPIWVKVFPDDFFIFQNDFAMCFFRTLWKLYIESWNFHIFRWGTRRVLPPL